MDTRLLTIAQYDYPLADDRIAQYPLANRHDSKLLVLNENGEILDHKFAEITNFLTPDTFLLFNNTKVIRARLAFAKETGAKIEIFCLEPHKPADYQLSFQAKNQCTWKCIVGNAKKWKNGSLSRNIECKDVQTQLTVYQENKYEDGTFLLRFEWKNSAISFAEILETLGNIPIPPYLNRQSEQIDQERYQTVYSKFQGSVAAPTAGLHFTPKILEEIQKKGIKTAEITLHVGAGTFKPVSSETIGQHDMHSEHFYFSQTLLRQLIAHIGQIVPVGTTSLRSLESLYWLGCKISRNPQLPSQQLVVDQWLPYEFEHAPTAQESLQTLLAYMQQHNAEQLEAQTQIIIAPGYKSQLIKGLITNFHQPKSTLLVLVSALVGAKWRDAYEFALANGYRFLSYGDSSLLMLPKK